MSTANPEPTLAGVIFFFKKVKTGEKMFLKKLYVGLYLLFNRISCGKSFEYRNKPMTKMFIIKLTTKFILPNVLQMEGVEYLHFQ